VQTVYKTLKDTYCGTFTGQMALLMVNKQLKSVLSTSY